MVFDINDFDETLPGPGEKGAKRLAASFVHAALSNGFSATDQRDTAMASVRSYREWIAKYSDMRALDVWYTRIDAKAVLESFSDRESVARAHARAGDAAMISGYVGKSGVFYRAIAPFSKNYADQVERDQDRKSVV